MTTDVELTPKMRAALRSLGGERVPDRETWNGQIFTAWTTIPVTPRVYLSAAKVSSVDNALTVLGMVRPVAGNGGSVEIHPTAAGIKAGAKQASGYSAQSRSRRRGAREASADAREYREAVNRKIAESEAKGEKAYANWLRVMLREGEEVDEIVAEIAKSKRPKITIRYGRVTKA